MTAAAFPLEWPEGWPRKRNPGSSRYKVGADQGRRDLLRQLKLLGASGVVLSSNVPIRGDGMPYADASRRKIDDAGVAVYFTRDRTQQVIACDTWDRPHDNIRAVGLTVAALRAIQRAGATELLDRAFGGFKALPAIGETTGSPPWWQVLEVPEDATLIKARESFFDLSLVHHPDHGGDAGAMATINRAWDQAKAELGG